MFEDCPGIKKLPVVDVYMYDCNIQLIRLRDLAASELQRFTAASRREGNCIFESKLLLQLFLRLQSPQALCHQYYYILQKHGCIHLFISC